ncbi:hypothetical protein BGX28_005962 [Mortierella sp. GBA30]|nr:hypothetical protein BGX28_005962 [Mortierella sp. GBA30]
MSTVSQPLSPVKQEPHIKQEHLSQLPPASQPYHPQPSFYQHQASAYSSSHQYGQQQQQQHQSASYANLQHPVSTSSSASMGSFSGLPPTGNYNLSRHLLAMNMQHGQPVSSSNGIANGSNGASGSGAVTPVMANAHANANGLSSAPSSPTLNNLQYHPSGGNSHFNSNVNSTSNSGSNTPYMQHPSYAPSYQGQQSHAYQHPSNYNSSPPYGSHPQQPGQQQPQQPHHSNGNGGSQLSSTAPSPMRQHQPQYAPLVPPLSDSQYAQYHQLLGSSAFSSAQSTPYHSNHSTPYSSMPGSPTLEYQQMNNGVNNNESALTQKPKRRQVKNACVNCQKACKKCDEGRPCTRCIKYGLTDTCVDSTRKVRKKGVKRGPYKRRIPAPHMASASAATSTVSTPTMRNAVPPSVSGYMSEPVTALSSPTQSHMLPFTSSATSSAATMGHMSAPLDFGYDTTSGGQGGYPYRMESSYGASYSATYSGSNLYAPPYGMSSNGNGNSGSNGNNGNSSTNNS